MTGSRVSDEPLFSVVIPVRDDAAGIERCLAGISRQNMPLEVIVIDDGSHDDSAAVAEQAGARVVHSGGRGAAAARNLGLAEARGDIVLFTDADCIPCPGWARRLVGPILAGEAIATKGTYRTRQNEVTARFVQVEYEERYDRMRGYDSIDFLDTYSLAVSRPELLAVGGFDEAFTGASVEDQEMSFRLREHGLFRFVPDAVVEHRHAASARKYFRKKFRIGRGKATLARRHTACLKGDSHTPNTLRYQVPAVIAALIAALGSLFFPALRWPACILSVTPILLSASLLARAVRRQGAPFLVVATALCLVRGIALAAGFVWGIASPLARLAPQLEPGSMPDTQPDQEVPEPPGLEVPEAEERDDVLELSP